MKLGRSFRLKKNAADEKGHRHVRGQRDIENQHFLSFFFLTLTETEGFVADSVRSRKPVSARTQGKSHNYILQTERQAALF